MKNNNRKAFTLLELLVVIGIIAVLISMVTVGYSRAQIGGRDAKRRQDLRSLQSAMEQYYSANNYSYPTCSTHAACTGILGSYFNTGSIPTDPLSPTNNYIYSSSGATNTYLITATLERDGTVISVRNLQ